ncbi:unnamed protein product [Parascedosporium putredinis]|uniref:Uncharacterized protein n=1 Tax=Parascedosporium putredinis TaxID=1442378 RepID=A0A9P1H5V9_9PEZI|nr:unnamed protein product [Parascedosporium putredinis]CAI7996803.1 unnamed protein product [Parascedosporium putredinis]
MRDSRFITPDPAQVHLLGGVLLVCHDPMTSPARVQPRKPIRPVSASISSRRLIHKVDQSLLNEVWYPACPGPGGGFGRLMP